LAALYYVTETDNHCTLLCDSVACCAFYFGNPDTYCHLVFVLLPKVWWHFDNFL